MRLDCDWPAPIPRFGIYNASTGSAHVVVDVVGVYFEGQAGDWGWRFTSMPNPKRFVDSRKGLGLPTNLGSNQARRGRDAVVDRRLQHDGRRHEHDCGAAEQHHGASRCGATTARARPTVSNLNPYAGQVVSNMTITEVWSDNDFRIHNLAGTAPVVIDAAGTMEYYPAFVPGSATGSAQRAERTTGSPGTRGSRRRARAARWRTAADRDRRERPDGPGASTRRARSAR